MVFSASSGFAWDLERSVPLLLERGLVYGGEDLDAW